jgi:hypothetical protein
MPARQQSSTSSTSSTSTSSSSSASTRTASTTSVSAPSQTASQTPPPTTTQTDDGKNSHAAAIGAGVGVPVGAIALGLIAYLAWRHRKRNTRKGDGLVEGMDGGYADNITSPQELDSLGPVAGATADRKSFLGGREYNGSPPPIRELDSERNAVHEMDGSGAR